MRIVDLLERDAALLPQKTAVAVDGGPAVTFVELRDRVRRLATGLEDAGVGRGDRVALMADNGLVFFERLSGGGLPGCGGGAAEYSARRSRAGLHPVERRAHSYRGDRRLCRTTGGHRLDGSGD